MIDMTDTGVSDASYNNLLLVGVGGSGVRAVRYALAYGTPAAPHLKAIDTSLARALETKNVVAVGIDTDSDEFAAKPLLPAAFPRAIRQQLQQFGDVIPLPTLDHEVSIKRDSMDEAIGTARKMQRNRETKQDEILGDGTATAKLVDSFLPISARLYDTLLPDGEEVRQGAGQLRALGRIGFLCGMETIHDTLENAIRDIKSVGDPQSVNVLLFGSLVGGTGAGMFLDVAIMIRNLLEPKANISGFFLLPEVFAAVSDLDRIWANGYAALKELSLLARPQNNEPIKINYKMGGEDNEVVIRKGDRALFEEIYLFDDTAMQVDGDLDGDLRRDAEVAAASRTMADTALALARPDIVSENKNKQNRLVGQARGTAETRRIFHSAKAWPLRPENVGNLAGTLFLTAYRDCIKTTISQLEIIEPIDTDLHSLENLRGCLQRSDEPIDGALTAETLNAEWTNTLDAFLQPAERILSESARSELKKMAKRLDSDVLEAWLKTNLGSSLFNIIASWKTQISQYPQDSHETLYENGSIVYQMPYEVVFDVLFSEKRLAKHLKYLTDLKAILESKRTYLSQGSVKTLERLSAEIRNAATVTQNKLSNENFSQDGVVTIKAPMEFFQQRVSFDAYQGGEKLKAQKLRKSTRPGPLVEDIQIIVSHIIDTIRKDILETSNPEADQGDSADAGTPKKIRTTVSKNAQIQAIERYISYSLSIKLSNIVDEILDLSKQNQGYLDKLETVSAQIAKEEFGYSTLFIEDKDVEHFVRIVGPMRRILSDLHIWLASENDKHIQARTRQNEIINAFEDSLKDARFESVNIKYNSADLLTNLIKKVGTLPKSLPPAVFIATLADIFTVGGLAEIQKKLRSAEDFTEIDYRNTLLDFITYSRKILSVWINQPEFELARLGGDIGIKESARKCQLTTFIQSRALGELSARHVTIALPDVGGRSHFEETAAKKAIRSAVNTVLQEVPIIAGYRSAQPLILNEQRYNAAFQLANIHKYQKQYKTVPEDIKPLYHVIVGGVSFPDIATEDSVSRSSGLLGTWNCDRHEEGELTFSIEVPSCPRCLEEYRRGKRRLSDIGRQHPETETEIPGVDQGSGTPTHVPTVLIKQFYNGAPTEERSFRPGTPGVFERQLKESGFVTELPDLDKTTKPEEHRIFPAVHVNPPKGHAGWEWVSRSANKNNRFIQFHKPSDPLFECYHCGFPTPHPTHFLPDGDFECPRCRRKLEACHMCSEDNGFLYEPDREDGDKTCPHCEKPMGPSPDISEANIDLDGNIDLTGGGSGSTRNTASEESNPPEGGGAE
ncbi:MAG: tubulin-like doman-containing protein [Rhodospirillaceae bacterium]